MEDTEVVRAYAGIAAFGVEFFKRVEVGIDADPDRMVLAEPQAFLGCELVGNGCLPFHDGIHGIDVPFEQVVLHEVAVALIVVGREAAVLVKVERRGIGEADVARLAVGHELRVQADGRGSRRKAQHAVGLGLQLGRDLVGGQTAHLVVIGSDDQFHVIPLLSNAPSRRPAPAGAAENRSAQATRASARNLYHP